MSSVLPYPNFLRANQEVMEREVAPVLVVDQEPEALAPEAVVLVEEVAEAVTRPALAEVEEVEEEVAEVVSEMVDPVVLRGVVSHTRVVTDE